jgi:arginase family enzyme
MIIPLTFKELVSDHFKEVLQNNKSEVNLNIFILGYECDQGVRACGGRSGTELGPSVFRNLLQEENQKSFDDLAKQLKKNGTVLYDLGDVKKFQLSKFMEPDHWNKVKKKKGLSKEMEAIREKALK